MEKDKSDRIKIANQHIKRAKQSLTAAKNLFDSELYADSLSRSYYAAYHAGYSAVYTLGYEPKTHKGLQNIMYIHLIDKQILPQKVLKSFSTLMEERGVADYGALPLIDREDAQSGIEHAEYVIETIIDYLDIQK